MQFTAPYQGIAATMFEICWRRMPENYDGMLGHKRKVGVDLAAMMKANETKTKQ